MTQTKSPQIPAPTAPSLSVLAHDARNAMVTWNRAHGHVEVLLGAARPVVSSPAGERMVRLPTAQLVDGQPTVHQHDAWVYQSSLRLALALQMQQGDLPGAVQTLGEAVHHERHCQDVLTQATARCVDAQGVSIGSRQDGTLRMHAQDAYEMAVARRRQAQAHLTDLAAALTAPRPQEDVQKTSRQKPRYASLADLTEALKRREIDPAQVEVRVRQNSVSFTLTRTEEDRTAAQAQNTPLPPGPLLAEQPLRHLLELTLHLAGFRGWPCGPP